MASAIEKHLYGSRGTHALLAFTVAQGRVTIVVAPWDDLAAFTEANFEAAELLSIWAAPDQTSQDISLPWDIIGFDSTELPGGRWEFLLYCSGVVEFCWRSKWPYLTRSGA
jgi:hypothetical protein